MSSMLFCLYLKERRLSVMNSFVCACFWCEPRIRDFFSHTFGFLHRSPHSSSQLRFHLPYLTHELSLIAIVKFTFISLLEGVDNELILWEPKMKEQSPREV
ncbi:hypothetical protein L6452_08097 [Arctium lappa]|uniref:Uncharacterized protein n=1 Tax=Arctium lappa TaxID=4217 RepID=A0ACB9DGU0_ARCLA|nr:hypothetical protein L6452_08097 [Arctium lappa]